MQRGAGFAITVEFELVSGALDRFLSLVKENAARSVSEEPGCLQFDVLVPEDQPDPARVLLYEVYVDRPAFDAHLLTEHFLVFDDATRDLVTRKTIVSFSATTTGKTAPASLAPLAAHGL